MSILPHRAVYEMSVAIFEIVRHLRQIRDHECARDRRIISQNQKGIKQMKEYTTCLKKYATFSGRASRREFWLFVLFQSIFGLVAFFVDALMGVEIINPIYSLAMILPGLAVSVRHLHDTGRSGWMLLLGLIPIVGGIVLLVYYVQPSKDAGEKYGPTPQVIG